MNIISIGFSLQPSKLKISASKLLSLVLSLYQKIKSFKNSDFRPKTLRLE